MKALLTILILLWAQTALSQVYTTNSNAGPPGLNLTLWNGTGTSTGTQTVVFRAQGDIGVTPTSTFCPLYVSEGGYLQADFKNPANGSNYTITIDAQPNSDGWFECWINSPLWLGYINPAAWDIGQSYLNTSYLFGTTNPGSWDWTDPLDVRTLFYSGTSGNVIGIRIYLVGDIAWLLPDMIMSSAGGGEGGVDEDDWDYWFHYAGPGEPGNGKFMDIYSGLTDWFGTDAEPGGQMDEVLGTLTDIYDTLNSGESEGLFDSDVDLSDVNLLYIDNDDDGLAIIDKREELMDIFQDLSIPEGMADATDAPTIEFDLPIDEWFGDLVNNFGADGVDMSPLHVEIRTEPFDEIRDPLHIIVFMLLSVWAALFIFNELKRA